MGTELTTVNAEIVAHPSPLEVERQRFLPIMPISQAVERREMMVQAVQKLMRPDHDYGKIPGVNKDVLLQPGAQKLDNLFGFVPRFEIVSCAEDWTGEDHGGEPFFQYNVKCQLWRGDFLMGEAIGSCSSWESKYRYRNSDRICPACSKNTIIKGKEAYGGGWICFTKKGGCNAKYKDGDKSIEGQATGKVKNPDIYDQVNTILKMAEKRAHVAATINATSASEFFTQDMEDNGGNSGSSDGPQPDPRGTKEAAAAVRDKKVTEMKNGKSYAEVSTHDPRSRPMPIETDSKPVIVGRNPVLDWNEAVAKKEFFARDKFQILDLFGEIKTKLSLLTGNDATYYQVIGGHGAKHANDFKGKTTSWACYRDLVASYVQIEASMAPPPPDGPPEAWTADDSDLPDSLRGQ